MTTTIVRPYLFFGGRCDEALEFYRTALGAKVDFLMRYNESPQPMPPGRIPPGFENKVMHATVSVGGAILNVSDGDEVGAKFSGISLALDLPTEAEASRAFAALAVGGEIGMPLSKTFWAPCFGMVTDRFGVSWMISGLTNSA
jgi:PhnB protein